MIKEVTGDLLHTKAKVIAHCVAPHDHFNQGLALELRKNYPGMAKDFRHYCRIHNPNAGEIWTWGGVGGMQIINLMAQEPSDQRRSDANPGKATIGNLNNCLKKLADFLREEDIKEIAIPKLATGVGGLDWEEVKESVYENLGDLPAKVIVYTTYARGIEAEE
ncbi:MAG: Appr-1-p processing protein [Saprospirales bacterium]|nr:MAG: Appr-1-p processing protein [Saprospirales bacterium]